METTFPYNIPVTGKHFTGRKMDLTITANLLRACENIVMYEPPRTGKTSLLNQSLYNLKLEGTQFRTVNFSLLNTRTAADLMMRLGSQVIRSTVRTPEEYGDIVEKMLPGTHFVFDRDFFEARGTILSLNWDIDDNDIRSIFALPFRIAEGSREKIFVILDDFQNIMLTEDGDRLCNILEEVFGEYRGKNCCYVMSGSQVNAMKYIFNTKRYFYRQVERIRMNDIDEKDITDYAVRGFLIGGKVIDRNLMLGACKLFRNHIGHIIHFLSICDSLSKGYITEQVLVEALNSMVAVHQPEYIAIMNDLTTFQVCLLRAIIDGNVKFSSSEVIAKYSLNSSANVRRLKDALCKKEIVTFNEKDEPEILDPLFEYWVTKYFFEIQKQA